MVRLLASFILFLALALPVFAGKRVALVIGNATYQHAPVLANPLNDAELIETALKKAGFEVIRKDNLDQKSMKLAFVEFARELKKGAEASMFYFAGHGIEVDGRNFLVPIDSDTQSKDEADVYNFDVSALMAMMENSGVPFNIMVLDACRNNPFRGFRSSGGGLAAMKAPVGSYVAYATSPGSVADDGDGRNSPFSEALAASMAIRGLPLEDVFKQTRTKVRAATNGAQVPFDSSAIEGSFYFLPPDAASPPVDNNVEARLGFEAAGEDPNMLRLVGKEYPNSIWGKLALEKLTTLESRIAINSERQKVQSPKEATEIEKIRIAATGGDANAMFSLGLRHDLGQGVAQNDIEAVAWYRKAAEKGVARAMFNLGWMYEYGQAVKQDDKEALSLYKKSVAAGYEYAVVSVKRLEDRLAAKSKRQAKLGKNRGNLEFPYDGLIQEMRIKFVFTTPCERDHFAEFISPAGKRVIVMDRGLKRCSGQKETWNSLNDEVVIAFAGTKARGTWKFRMFDLDKNQYEGTLDEFWMEMKVNNKGKFSTHKVSLGDLPQEIPYEE